MEITTKQIEFARDAGELMAIEACRESLSTSTPSGGFDSYLLEAGESVAASVLGIPSLTDSEGNRLEIADRLLQEFHDAASAAAAEYERSEELAALRKEASDLRELESAALAAEASEANRQHLEELFREFSR